MVIGSRHFVVVFVLVATLFATGCTHIYKVPDVSLKTQGSDYVIDKKIDLAVNLSVTEDFKATKWEKHMMGDTFIIPIGDQLVRNASELSGILFKDVMVDSAPVSPGSTRQVDATLTPRVVGIERALGAHAFAESIFTVVLEWKLEDAQNNVVWADSVKGEGRANTGNIFTHSSNAEKQTEMLLKDLFRKSFQAIRMSPEISQFAARKRQAATP
jgi:hypothetical protein